MLDRWNQFMLLLQVGLASNSVSWITQVNIVADCQDENIRYKVQTRSNQTVANMVIEYIKWKTGSGGKPEWFIKSGE